MEESFADTISRENFAFKNRMSVQGQWASENLDEVLKSGSAGQFQTMNSSKRTGQTDDIVTEEDFTGNPQVRSKDDTVDFDQRI